MTPKPEFDREIGMRMLWLVALAMGLMVVVFLAFAVFRAIRSIFS